MTVVMDTVCVSVCMRECVRASVRACVRADGLKVIIEKQLKKFVV